MKHKIIQWILMGLFLVISVQAINLIDDQCDTTTAWNKTGILSYNRINITYCCESETTYLNQSINYTDINLTLTPGETLKGTTNQWNYEIICQGEQSNMSICEYDITLDPGEKEHYESPSCDIEVKCKNHKRPTCDDEIEERTTSVNVQWQDYANYTELYLDGFTYRFQHGANASGNKQIDATCAFSSNQTNGSCSFLDCQKYNIPGTFLANSFEAWTKSLTDMSTTEKECWSMYGTILGNEGECQNYLATARTERDNCVENLEDSQRQLRITQTNLDNANLSRKFTMVWMIIFIVGFSLTWMAIIIMGIVMYMRRS